ncbi:MAG: anthranilate synthase component I [Verrucomicrobiales bacterium]|nr:anthranilate synthase component I [Verrucomicrobiae bacterium]
MIPLKPTFDEFRALSDKGNLIPVYTELAADYETPVSAFRKLQDGSPCFLLESAESSEQIGRFSFLGFQPRVELRAHGRDLTLTVNGSTTKRTLPESEGDPLHELERIMSQYQPVPLAGLPVFTGGAVGYLAYDMVRFFEPTVTPPPPDTLGLPDMVFLLTDTLVIFDHRFRRLQVVAHVKIDEHASPEEGYADARRRIEDLVTRLGRPVGGNPMPLLVEPPEIPASSNTTQSEYEGMVRAAKEYILAGDIFQVVPSQRFTADYTGSPIDLYRALRHVNPSPYMFCLQFGEEFALVGSSPEVHVRAVDGQITIRPIAGTRKRGNTQEEDNALAADLLADPKECAEHVMLVDLARNDVGRVADFHSVQVTEFMGIERYSHVMHIVSNVIGRIAPGHNAYDVMRATFPAGTVSGSPKVRAMQIIHELEKAKRCAYAGAVGYFGYDGNHDSCIALRTVVLKDGKAHVQAGAGVVADSDPTSEYQETVNKAMGSLRAIARAQNYSRDDLEPSS